MLNRVDVSVSVVRDADGNIRPKVLHWPDGREWLIHRVLHVCRSPDGEYVGTRYTVLIAGMEKYLYRDGRQWYVDVA